MAPIFPISGRVENSLAVTAAAVRTELKYLSANELAKQIGAIKLGPPDTSGHKRAATDRIPRDPACAAVAGVLIREDRVGQPRGLRAAVSRRSGGARAFANIPAVNRKDLLYVNCDRLMQSEGILRYMVGGRVERHCLIRPMTRRNIVSQSH